MSYRPQIDCYPVIINGDMSANITSSASIIGNISVIGYSYSWTGTSPVGTISIQVSNDYALGPSGLVANSGTWTTLAFSLSGSTVTSAPVSGNSGTGFIDIDITGAYAIRTLYNFTSGVGTLQAIINAKVT